MGETTIRHPGTEARTAIHCTRQGILRIRRITAPLVTNMRPQSLCCSGRSFVLFLAMVVMMAPGALAFISPAFAVLKAGPNQRSVLSRLPARRPVRPPRHLVIRAMDLMDLSVFSEGFDQGYALFEFIGRRLPTAFFKELGTPHRTPMWMAFFMLSNVAFPIAGIKILVSRERANRKLAIFVFLVGFISTAFHWSQCSLGSGSPVTHTWCLVDTTFSCVSGLAYLTHSWGTIRKRMIALFGLGIVLLFDTSKFYTITHSLWHVCSAYVAYRLVKDRDKFLTSKGKTTLLHKTSKSIVNVIEENVGLDEDGRQPQVAPQTR